MNRNLRIAVVDDQPKALSDVFENMEQVFVPTYGKKLESNCISSWAQTMEFLACRQRPQIDLLCIDARFHHDQTDLPYFNEIVDGAVDDSSPNPMGLLLGAVIAASYVQRSKPFGFAIYSVNAGSLARDPIAVACMGLLEAISGNVFSKIAPDSDVRNVVMNMLDELPSSSPSGIRSTLLERYRADFLRVVSEFGSIDVENDFVPLLEQIEQRENLDTIKNRSLSLVADDSFDSIRISSLFADFPSFDNETIETKLTPFLVDAVRLYRDCRGAFFATVCAFVEALDEAHSNCIENNSSLFIPILKSHMKRQDAAGRLERSDLVLAGICCVYLEILNLAKRKAQNAMKNIRIDLLNKLCVNDQKTIDRELEACSGNIPKSFGKFVESLQLGSLRLPTHVKDCCFMYARKFLNMEEIDVPKPFKR